MESARVFVGLKPPEAVSQLIVRYQKNLQEAILDRGSSINLLGGKQSSFVRWTAQDSLHLTLHFIGSVSREVLDSLRWKFREKVYQIKPFKVTLGSMGFLPKNRKNMRVVYLSVLDPEKNLDSLAARIRSCVLEQFGLANESAVVVDSDISSSAVSQADIKQSEVLPSLDQQTALSERKQENVSFYETLDKLKKSHPFLKGSDSPFLPHITLGRLERTAKREERDYLASVISKTSLLNEPSLHIGNTIEWEVKSFVFYESVQEDGHSQYKILEEFYF